MYDENSILEVVDNLRAYKEKGGMDGKQIDKIISKLQNIYICESIASFKMMDEEDELEDFVKKNMKSIAVKLDRSVTTIYRKLHDHSFTLIELEQIKKMRIEEQ